MKPVSLAATSAFGRSDRGFFLGSNRFKRLVIRPSRIHGKGVFTTFCLKKGELVFSTSVYRLTHRPVCGSVQRSSDEHIVEPTVIRWINHCCDPNAALVFHGIKVGLIAKREIPAAEELTCFYPDTEDYVPLAFSCNCGYCDGVDIR